MRLHQWFGLQYVTPVVSALALLLTGCEETTNTGTTTGGAPSCDPAADVPSVGSLVAISTITFSPDLSMRTDTIQFADNLTAGGKVDNARTIELAGTNSTIWPSKNAGEMFLAEADTGTVKKYGLAADGKIEEKGKVGFGAYGVTSFYWTLIASESSKHAFLFDEKTLQGFVWNPDCMTITSKVDLKTKFNTMEAGESYTVWREIQTLEVGGKYFASFHYFNPSTAAILPRSGMIIIDPAKDSFDVVEIQNCAGLHNSVLGKDGKIYSGSGVIAAGSNFLGVPGSMCLARFDPATMKWDDTYKPDVPKLVDPAEAQFVGGLYKNKSDPNAPVYVRMLLKAMVPMGLKSPLNVAAVPLWKTFKLDDITNPTAATDTMVKPAGGIIYPIEMDGKTYVSDAAVQSGTSKMIDLSTDPPTEALPLTGWGYYAVKFH